MSSVPPLTATQNTIRQLARGTVAAFAGGLPYNVFRLTAQPSGAITNAPPVISNFPAKILKGKQQTVEIETFELEVFNGTCNNSTLQFGDILVGASELDPTWYAFAQYRVLGPSLFVRVETTAKIFRPRANGAPPSGAPSAGPGQPYLASGFESSDLSTRLPIVLNNGVYAFGEPTDTPALIPVGLQLTARAGGPRGSNSLPSSSTTARYIGYVPPLGIVLNQNDEIYIDDDHTYIVNLALTATVGLVGTVCILEEEGI